MLASQRPVSQINVAEKKERDEERDQVSERERERGGVLAEENMGREVVFYITCDLRLEHSKQPRAEREQQSERKFDPRNNRPSWYFSQTIN